MPQHARPKKLLTRERVLKAAAAAIRSEGPERVSIAGIMSEVGLTHGGFYYHFASREDFIAAAIGQMFQDCHDRLRRETTSRLPADALAAYVEFYLSPAHRDTTEVGCPVPFLSSEASHLSTGSRRRFASGVAGVIEVLAGFFRQLGRSDPDAEALSLLSELAGALALARAEPDPALSAAMLATTKITLKRKVRLGTPH